MGTTAALCHGARRHEGIRCRSCPAGALRCPSTQPAQWTIAVRATCACLTAVWRLAEPDSSRIRRCAGHGSCSRPFVGAIERELAHTASRASKQRMSLRAAAHSGCAFASMQSRSLAPCRDTRLLPINIPGRPLAHACASPTRRAHLRYRSCTCTLKATLVLRPPCGMTLSCFT